MKIPSSSTNITRKSKVHEKNVLELSAKYFQYNTKKNSNLIIKIRCMNDNESRLRIKT